MKFLLALALFVLAASAAGAQSLSLFDIDATNFPAIKAKFHAFDAAGNPVRPNIGNVSITEDGTPRTVTNITCPPPVKSTLSVCIMVDTKYPIGLVRAGAERLVNFLDMPQDELGITVMQRGVQIHRDFTRDRAKALAAAGTIPGAPGVDVQAMFYAPITGGVPFITGQKADKKVLILVSDLHCPYLNLNEQQLYADAAKENISVYSILLHANDYTGLFKRVAANTGGKVFEKVTTETEITNIFQEIERFEHWEPCEITWQSGATCEAGNTVVALSWSGQTAFAQYPTPTKAIAELAISPSFIFCKSKPVGTPFDTTVTITANNATFTVDKIVSSNPVFEIIEQDFTLNAGQSQLLTIRYTPADSGYAWTKFDIQNDICPQTFFASGFPGKKPTKKTLKLTHPNGGEVFVAGSDTVITWDGIAKPETVELEYSIDNGSTWKSITTSASNLQYIWKNIPKPASNQCKVRIKQKSVGTNGKSGLVQFTLSGHTSYVSVSWSPDGTKVATGSADSTARIWSAVSGTTLLVLSGHTNSVTSVSWSPDGTRVATGSWDNTARIWSAVSGAMLLTLSGHTGGVTSVSWSPDGLKVATESVDRTARIWSAVSGAALLTSGHTIAGSSVSWSPDGTKVATGSYDHTAIIWSAVSGTTLLTLGGHTSYVSSVSWSPDGTKVATGSEDRTARIWSALSGVKLLTLSGHTHTVSSVSWSPDGTKVATGSYDRTARIWSAVSGAMLLTLSGHTGTVTSVSWSPDGAKVATGSYDNTAKIWFIDDAPLQEDESDATFSIIAPEPVIQVIDVDMGKVVIGDYKDNNEPAVICNRGAAPLHVLGLDVTSGDTQDFMISRGAGDFFLAPNGGCQDITFTFTPTKVGKRSAKATLRTTVGNFTDTITIHGEGIAPLLQVETPMVYFGKVLIGATKDTLVTVTIRNVGTAPLVIQDTHHDKLNNKDFKTLAGGGGFTLAPGATHPMQLRFVPSEEGRTTGLLSFEYNGPGSPALLQLIGEGFRPDSGQVALVAGTASAFPGEQTYIPITLELPQNSTLSNLTGFDVTLKYNSTLLFPADNSMTVTSSGNDAVLTFFAPYNPAGGELLRIPFIATLGDDTTTVVKIEKAVPRVGLGKVDVTTRNGSFALKGVCYAGGAARLYKPSGRAMLIGIRPNPAEDEAEIEYETSETGATSIKVFNALGMEVSVPASGEMNAGFHVAKVRTSDFGAGTYFVVMTTPTERHVARFEVVR